MLHGHPIAREMEEWWRDHAQVPGDSQWEAFLAAYESLWGGKRAELEREHSNAGRFGMSKAGGCTRAAALKLLGHPSEPFTGSTLFTFFLGHEVELLVLATLQAMGYEVGGAQEAVRIDPMMHSYVDGTIVIDGKQYVLSVKSTGYKKSGKQGTKWVRRGFPELPFHGIRATQPGWWAQAQAEMHGSGIEDTLIVVASKDIIKSMEGDPFLGEKGNGSLTFYAEHIPAAPQFVEAELLPTWNAAWESVQEGRAGAARYLSKGGGYIDLKIASTDWMPNADRTGTFNPCNYCDLLSACSAELGQETRSQRVSTLAPTH